MKISIAHRLKKVASLIMLDTTPSEEEILERRGRRIDQLPDTDKKCAPVIVAPKKVIAPKVKVQDEVVRVKITPKIKPSRALPEHMKVWNKDNMKEKRNEYQKDYRDSGKVFETDGPKNFYVKKPK